MTDYIESGSTTLNLTGTSSETYTSVAYTPQINYAYRYVVDPNTPKAVGRRRKTVYDIMRRLGSPFLFKHKWTDEDVSLGIAQKSPAYDDIYQTSLTQDNLSHGVGFVSQELSPNEWYDPSGNIIVSATNPGYPYIQAPMYRGYGPGWLVWCIQSDTPTDYLKLDEGGVVIRVQEPQILCPYFPSMNDGDLLIACEIDREMTIVNTYDRYELKQVRQVAIRGYDMNGRRETGINQQTPVGSTGAPFSGPRGIPYTSNYTNQGNSFVINQISVENRLPNNVPAYDVEIDR
jgi:hypothetical protein